MRAPQALNVGTERAAAVGTFGPFDAEPVQIFDHALHELRAAALRIQVFVAENQLTMMLAGALRGGPERERVTEVEQTSGRWSKTATVKIGDRIVWHRWTIWP
jgi:hypothetical protein